MSEIYELKKQIDKTNESIKFIFLYQKSKIQNYYLKQQNVFLKQELKLNQNKIDKFLEIRSSQCKDINYSKNEVRKPSTKYQLQI